MLIDSPRLTPEDRAAWARLERHDTRLGGHVDLRRAGVALWVLADFARAPCYCGVSWGKDSLVVAHLCARLAEQGGPVIPLVWVRVEPLANPDCALVRDAFLVRFEGYPYAEIETQCAHNGIGWVPKGTLERGFAEARDRFGARHVSGIRGEESGGRARRMRTHGETSSNTCAPIGWWTGPEVFAYLHYHDLPVHPAYAMSFGGALDRTRLRVSSLGMHRGSGHGKIEWERAYYRAESARIGRVL